MTCTVFPATKKQNQKRKIERRHLLNLVYMSFLYMECTSIQFVVTCNIWFEISFSLSTFWSEPMCF